MYTSSHRFGDERSKQTKLQRHRVSQKGSGRRRQDPSIHATSRPWHTSAPGIKMNVSTLGQIAAQNPVAAKYLNRMKLSELAQKKRGLAEKDEGRGIDKIGKAVKRGTQHSVASRRSFGGPGLDKILQWEADITGRIGKAQAQPQLSRRSAGTSWAEHVAKLKGLKKKIPKRPFHTFGTHNPYF